MPALKKYENNKVVAEREAVKPLPSDEVRKAIMNEIIADHTAKLLDNIDFEFYFDCGELYTELESLGIFQFSYNQKFEIYDFVKKKYPNGNETSCRAKAKHQAWINYILSLIEWKIDDPIEEVELPKKNARPTVKIVY